MSRFAFVTHSPVVWGAERSLFDLASFGARSGHAIAVMAPSGSEVQQRLPAGVEFVPLDFWAHPALDVGGFRAAATNPRVALGEFRAVRRARDELREKFVEWAPDVAVSFSLWATLPVALAARADGVPMVADVHETFDSRLGAVASGVLHRMPDLVLAPSEYTLCAAGVPTNRPSAVVPRAVAPRESQASRASVGSALRVGCFGQIERSKGLHVLVEAAALASREVALEVDVFGAGDSDYARELIETASNCGAPVRFHEPIDDVHGVMEQMDVIVSCASREAFGRTVIEGMSAGCYPLVASGSGPSEVVRAAGTGIIVQHGRADDLARALIDLTHSRNSLRSRRASFAGVAKEKFSPAVVYRRYFELLSSVVAT